MIRVGRWDQQEKWKRIRSLGFRVWILWQIALAQENLFQEEAVDIDDPWKLRNPDLKSFSKEI